MKKLISLVCLISFFFAITVSPPYLEANNDFPWEMFMPAMSGNQAEIYLASISDPNSSIIAMATDKKGNETVAAIGIKDSYGNPISITGYIYYLSDGSFLELKLNDNGIPVSLSENNGNKFLFSDFTGSTVTITVYDNNNNQISPPKTVPINQRQLDEGIQLRSSIEKIETFENAHLSLYSSSCGEDCTCRLLYNVILAGVKGAGLYISAVALAITIAKAPVILTGSIIIASTSFLLGTLSMFTLSDDDSEAIRIFKVLHTKFEEAICVTTPTYRQNILACMNNFAEKVVQIYFKPCNEIVPIGTPINPFPTRPKDTWLGIGIDGNGSGSVTSYPVGINCPGDCSNIYPTDQAVTLKAIGHSGSVFKNWSGACEGTGPQDTIYMYRDKACTATFELLESDISGSWSGSWWITSPSACIGMSGGWTATFSVSNGVISGYYSGGGYSGPISGTWDGTTATWTVSGAGDLSFSGTVSGSNVTGNWWGGEDCYPYGPTSGGFSGSKDAP